MTQSHKFNPKITNLLDAVDKTGNFKIIQDYNKSHIRNRTCSNCEKKVDLNKMNDAYCKIERKEYFISGLCDECQPYFFFEKEAI